MIRSHYKLVSLCFCSSLGRSAVICLGEMRNSRFAILDLLRRYRNIASEFQQNLDLSAVLHGERLQRVLLCFLSQEFLVPCFLALNFMQMNFRRDARKFTCLKRRMPIFDLRRNILAHFSS